MTETKEILHHAMGESDKILYERIDRLGGWPVGMKYLNHAHSDERECEFSNIYHWDGWWSTRHTADDYYWWKLSEAKKEEVRKSTVHDFIIGLRP